MAYAIGRLYDIARPPGGRLIFPQMIRVAHPVPKARSPTPSGQIKPNPTLELLGAVGFRALEASFRTQSL